MVTATTDIEVPTPRGLVGTHLENTVAGLRVQTFVPSGSTAHVRIPRTSVGSRVLVDGQLPDDFEMAGNTATFTLPGGAHDIQIFSPFSVSIETGSGSTASAHVGQISNWSTASTSAVALTVIIDDTAVDATQLEYAVFSPSAGWSDYVTGNSTAKPTDGSAITGIRYRLTGDLAQTYDVQYRALTSNNGWLGWTGNGGDAGTSMANSSLLGMHVDLVAKGTSLPGGDQPSFSDTTSIPSFRSDLIMVRRGNAYHIKNSLSGGVADEVVYYGKPADTVLVGKVQP